MYPDKEIDRYKALFYSSPTAGLIFDRTSLAILTANTAATRLYGYSLDEFLAHSIRDLFCDSDRPLLDQKLEAAGFDSQKTGPWCHRKRDGGLMYVELTLQSYNMNGQPAVLAAATDITTRLETEQVLMSNEHLYREIFENANDILYTHDLQGNFTTINRAAERITGFSKAEAARLNIEHLVAPEYLDVARTMIQRKLGGEKPTTYELEILSKNGRRIPLEVSTRLQFQDGRPVAVQGIARDISERRLAQQKLENYARELQRKNEELAAALEAARAATETKSRFLANVSHEIRTPMNGIIGMIHLLLDSELAPEQRDYASTVLQSATSLMAIMNDILDFSKIEAGRLTIEAVTFSPEETIRSVQKLVGMRASAKGLELTTKIAPDLPALVIGDSLRFRQILMNLLANAIKFTDSGSVALEASLLESHESHSLFRFAVSDTGIGIPARAQERIFESFVQADDSSTRLYGGTGLGLAISKQLVELMGGQIGVQSEPGKGSTFWFVIPLGLVTDRASTPP